MSSKRPLALASVASRVINFGRPNNLIGKQLEASQITLRQLLAVMRANADNNCIAAVIKQHASIGLMLRRLVNAPGSGVANRVDSSHELAKCLAGANSGAGCRPCRMHWRAGTRHAIPLLARGKLLKLIAHRLAPKQHAVADTAFRVGIVALMDTLFHQPMVATMLSQIVVSDDVSRALLERSGFFGDPLKLAEWIERLDVVCEMALPILVKLRLWAKALNTMQLRGFEWGNQLSDPMRWQQHVLDATGMRPVS